MLEIIWASMEFTTSLEISDDNMFMVTIIDCGTHDAWTKANATAARFPEGVLEEPIMT